MGSPWRIRRRIDPRAAQEFFPIGQWLALRSRSVSKASRWELFSNLELTVIELVFVLSPGIPVSLKECDLESENKSDATVDRFDE